jgi:ABC-type multidrug transport system permease subunit
MNLTISQIINSVLFSFGVAGGLLSVYGVSVDLTEQRLAWVEKMAPWLASLSTIAAVMVTVSGVYFDTNPRPPYLSSKVFWAPFIFIYGVLLAAHFVRQRIRNREMNEYTIIGYAMVGLAVTCIRQFVTAL